jgi:hypothetical protein
MRLVAHPCHAGSSRVSVAGAVAPCSPSTTERPTLRPATTSDRSERGQNA